MLSMVVWTRYAKHGYEIVYYIETTVAMFVANIIVSAKMWRPFFTRLFLILAILHKIVVSGYFACLFVILYMILTQVCGSVCLHAVK